MKAVRTYILLTILLLAGRVTMQGQENVFFSILEDIHGISLKPNDIVETLDGKFLIIANEDGGTKTKILKLDAGGTLMREVVIAAQDTTLKLFNLYPTRESFHNGELYKAVGTCSPVEGGRAAIITVWFDTELNVSRRMIEPIEFSDHPIYASRFMGKEDGVVASLMFDGDSGKDVFLARLSSDGEIIRYEECDTDSLLFVANLFPVHGEQDKIGMFALTSNSSQARSGVLVFDSLLMHERSVFFPRWEAFASGHVLWSYVNADECMMIPVPEGNYVLSSKLWEKEILPNGTLIQEDRSVILAKVDENFEMLHDSVIIEHFNDSIEIPAPFKSVAFTEDGYLYQCSNGNVIYPNSLYKSGLHLIITKTDMDMNVVWQKRYLRDGSAYGAFTSSATTDGGFIVTGTRYNFNVDNRRDIFVLKTDADGMVGIDEDNIVDEIEVYPNPGKDVLNIRTGLKDARVEVYDMNGRMVYWQEITENVTLINAEGWPAGTYVWKVVANGMEAESGKWIKE